MRAYSAWPAIATGLLLVATGLAGCLGAGDGPAAMTDEAERAASAPLLDYLKELSAPIPGVSLETAIIEQYRVPAPDGALLDTWIVRPDIPGPVPVVLEVTPYYGGGPPILSVADESLLVWLGVLPELLVERGYAFGVSSVRGTGNSEGCFTQGGPTEGKDTAAVIEALAAEPWSTGNVGLIGVSYPGTTPQQVWLEAPPSLKTIVPISGISDFYKYNFANGVPINPQGFAFNAYYWAMVGVSPAGLSGGAQVLDPLGMPGSIVGQACMDQIEVQSAGVQATLDGDKAAYWQARDFARLHRDTWERNPERASVFYIHGLQDWNVKPHHMEEWLDQLQTAGVPYKVWLGQWAHSWPSLREDWWNATVIAWFDEWLKGMDTGIMDAPNVQVQDDSRRWRHEAVWPPLETLTLLLHPTADGRLAAEPATGDVTYHDRAGREQLNAVPLDGVFGPAEVRFESQPLTEDIIITGQPRLVLAATATGQRASLMLSLHEVTADGARSFNFGVQSLNHAHDLEAGESDIAGKRMQVDLLFFPQDSHIQAGSTIRLIAAPNLIASIGPRPSFDPVADGSHITLHLDGAYIEFPYQRVADVVFEDPQPCWETLEEGQQARCGTLPA